MNNFQKIYLFVFAIIELVCFVGIFTMSGVWLVATNYLGIVLCFVTALIFVKEKKNNLIILVAFVFTMCADFCLVVLQPMQQQLGMTFFVGTQLGFAVFLFLQSANDCEKKTQLIVRLGLMLLAVALAIIVLGKKTDYLSIVAMIYFANLIVNIVFAFKHWKDNPLFAIGLVLFLLCDLIVGLQCAEGNYVQIDKSSIIYKILHCGFNLAWLFYLPSQILISLSTIKLKG